MYRYKYLEPSIDGVILKTIADSDSLQHLSESLLEYTKRFIKKAEELNCTNNQWFLDFEIEMNKLTVKDHNI